jgi:hypothetical protein
MTTAVAQIPTETASATAQMTSHIIPEPPIIPTGGNIRPMVFKICRDQAEMSPVQRIYRHYPIT